LKIIALERGLDNLKAYLDSKGYYTVFADDISTAGILPSAFIYKDPNAVNQQLNIDSSFKNNTLLSTAEPDSGILLIYAKGISPEQIVYMIENRLYSPLF
jgi:hypothetical protein